MRSHKTYLRLVVLVSCLWSMDCASINAPTDWLADPDDLPSEVYGGWIRLSFAEGEISGELIAVSQDSVFLADTILHGIPSSDIVAARLVTFDAGGGMGAGVFVGTLSTISNGFYLIITAPMWLIGGSAAASSRSFDPVLDFPKTSMHEIAQYARYPGGLPPGLPREGIRMKAGPSSH